MPFDVLMHLSRAFRRDQEAPMAHSVTCDVCGTARVVDAGGPGEAWAQGLDWRGPLPAGWFLLGMGTGSSRHQPEAQRHVCTTGCAVEAVRGMVAELEAREVEEDRRREVEVTTMGEGTRRLEVGERAQEVIR